MITARPLKFVWDRCEMNLILWFLIYLMVYVDGQAVQDSRCYLMNGGAVESFFVSEDAPVGSVIGTLSVNGDPHESLGNIVLSLNEKNTPVVIAPGTKNITLIRALDREEVNGPSSIYVNVRCDRRRTNDPSFIIPVSVRVTDVNDNPPIWQDAPYYVRLSEQTAVGSRILQNIRATDADQHGPHSTVEYSIQPGPHSDYFAFVNSLDSMLVVKKPLDYETVSNFTIILRAQDQGNPPLFTDTELNVEVIDADDQNPKFQDDHYTAVLPDDYAKGMGLVISPRPITAYDQDLGINAPIYYSLTGDHKDLFTIDKDSGQVFIMDDLNAASVAVPLTLVIKATQEDNPDKYALATLSVTKRSTNNYRPVKFTQKTYTASVLENMPLGSVLMTLTTNKQREQLPLQFYVSDRSFLSKFAINSAGEVILRKSLDYEVDDTYKYQVMVTDGQANDTASLNINVLNVNDWEPRFRYPQYEFYVNSDRGFSPNHIFVGKVEVADGDKDDYVKLSLRGQDANLFYINDMGEIYLRDDAVPLLNSSLVNITVMAVDSGTPPRQTSVPVVVHVSEELISVAGLATASNGGVVIIIVFATLLSLLALIVLILIVYIYRGRQSKPSPRSSKITSGFVQHNKLPKLNCSPTSNGFNKNGFGGTNNNLATTTGMLGVAAGSLQSVSAGASTILADSNSSLNVNSTLGRENGVIECIDMEGGTTENGHSREDQYLVSRNSLPTRFTYNRIRVSVKRLFRNSQRFPQKPRASHKISPAPQPPILTSRSLDQMAARSEQNLGQSEKGGSETLMSDHIHTSQDRLRSGVAWPAATIPARVKKLSWDDDDKDHRHNSSEIHDATNPTVADQMNLTVYF